ncbi:MAG TPA: tetratricopeptide repeat protein [Chitinivibrionales bacterium]
MDQSSMLQRAVELHRQGDAPGAEALYRAILAADPRSADGLHLMGLLLRQRGSKAEAVDYLINACAARPSNARFLIDCADALDEYTYYEDAAAFYSLALRCEPENARIWFALGCAHQRAGNADAALNAMRKAVDCKPDYFDALCNCAELLRQRKDFSQALSCLQRALALKPDFAGGHNAIGLLHEAMRDDDKALEHYQRAVHIDGSFAEAHNNIGTLLSARGDFLAAIASYKRALAVKPDFFEATYNIANSFRQLHDLDEAIDYFAVAVRLKPQSAPALSNFGEALMAAGRAREARHYFKAAAALPGEHRAAAYSNLLLCKNYDPELSVSQIYVAHMRYAAIAPASAGRREYRSSIDPHRKLRLGYVSADFCNHPVARFIEPVLSHHDRENFDVFCYANQARSDAVTRRLQSMPLSWRGIVDSSDDHVENMIHDDGIDILIDLAGHTAANRLPLFAKKPSPIQISYCGYPNTTGLTAIDYYLTDEYLDTRDDESLFTERLIRIPDCFCCYMPQPMAEPLTASPCARNGYITFGSLHPIIRLNDAVLDLWSAVLRAIPSARLRIIRDTLTGRVGQRIADAFISRGIDMQRIDVEHTLPRQGHLALFNEIDIALDTFPWSGHTGACEALWMGVPVITLYGNRHAGRMAATILHASGLHDWIGFSPEEYLEIAQAASENIDQLKFLRQTLRRRMSASIVGDAPAFTRKLEAVYRTVWMQWCGQHL